MWKIRINRELFPLKVYYFLFVAGAAPIMPFLTLFARQKGLSEVDVGLVFGLMPFAGLLSKPAYGALSDWLGRRRLILTLVLLLSAACNLGLVLLPDTSESNQEGILQPVTICTPNSMKQTPDLDGQVWRCLNPTGLQACPENVVLPIESQCRVFCPSADGIGSVNRVEVNYNETCTRLWVTWRLWPSQFQKVGVGECKELECRLIDCPQEVGIWNEEGTSEESMIPSSLFWALSALVMAGGAHMLASMSLSDAVCYSALGPKDRLKFGQQRLWGTIGWGIFSFLGGLMVNQLSMGKAHKDYSPCFYMGMVITLCAILAVWKIRSVDGENGTNNAEKNGSATSDATPNKTGSQTSDTSLWSVLVRPSAIVFFLWCIIFGMSMGLLIQFHFWYIEDLTTCEGRQSIKLLQGIILGLRCFGAELPFLMASGWFIKKIGIPHCLTFGMATAGVRFILYWLIQDPWWALPLEVLHGPAFAISIVALTSYASTIAPPGCEATMQGVAGACWDSIGLGSGTLIAGVLFRKIGGGHTFLAFGIALLVMALLHALVTYALEARSQPKANADGSASKCDSVKEADDIKHSNGVRSNNNANSIDNASYIHDEESHF